jgi:hypothetical protein
MDDTIRIRDEAGEMEFTYGEILKYHGRDFYGGVALAFKVLKLAFNRLAGDEPPHRNEIRLVVGFDPPGVVDALEFITRALTRRRLILDPDPQKGPESVFGRYYFEVHLGNRFLRLWLRSGLLPEGFTLLARKAFAGIATPEEISRWKGFKQQIGHDLMAMHPEEIMEVQGPFTMNDESMGLAI